MDKRAPVGVLPALARGRTCALEPRLRGISGFWSVSRYEDVKAVELNPQVFSSQRGSINLGVQSRDKWKPKKLIPAALNSLINMDAPMHMEARIQQKDFFIPAYVAKIRDKVAAHIDGLLDEMEAKGPEVDFVKMFAEQVPKQEVSSFGARG